MPTLCSCGCGRTANHDSAPGDPLCLFSWVTDQEAEEVAEQDQAEKAPPSPATPF